MTMLDAAADAPAGVHVPNPASSPERRALILDHDGE
jgi:hypothetical protein